MRLLHTTSFKFHSFSDPDSIPPYAILSHRWGDGEILYEDMLTFKTSVSLLSDLLDNAHNALIDARADGKYIGGKNFDKLRMCCHVAHEDGYEYVWMDTCCIDQRSSAELSESINSMFEWYKKSRVCYAFLKDVPTTDNPRAENSTFRNSEWFRRGWTLQELIAPRRLVFLSATWEVIGTKKQLADVVEAITNIEYAVLCGYVQLTSICAATKMSWASNRRTTKVEDRAYSLLGLFGVNMTTIYGEGKQAFRRLQHEIIRQSTDHTIFAWEHNIYSHKTRGTGVNKVQAYSPYEFDDSASVAWRVGLCDLLAPSPDQFVKAGGIVATPYSRFSAEWGIKNPVAEFHTTNAGIHIELPLFPAPYPSSSYYHVAALACKKLDPFSPSARYYTVGIIICKDTGGRYGKKRCSGLVNVDLLIALKATYMVKEIYAIDEGTDRDAVLLADGTDADGDGRIEVVVAPLAHTAQKARYSLDIKLRSKSQVHLFNSIDRAWRNLIDEARKKINLKLDYRKLYQCFNVKDLIAKTPTKVDWVRTQSIFHGFDRAEYKPIS